MYSAGNSWRIEPFLDSEMIWDAVKGWPHFGHDIIERRRSICNDDTDIMQSSRGSVMAVKLNYFWQLITISLLKMLIVLIQYQHDMRC